MINNLINAIALKLTDLYPTYNIYTEEVSQAAMPAFFIGVFSSSLKKELAARSRAEIVFDIVCQMETGNVYEQYWDIAAALNEAFQYLDADGNKHKIFDRIGRITDGVLHYKFTVKTLLFEAPETEAFMQEISGSTAIKE